MLQGEWLSVVALRSPMEINLGSEGRVHIHLAGMAIVFSGELRGDRDTERKKEEFGKDLSTLGWGNMESRVGQLFL